MKTFQELYNYGLNLPANIIVPIDEKFYKHCENSFDRADWIRRDYHFSHHRPFGAKRRSKFIFWAPGEIQLVAIEFDDPRKNSIVTLWDIPDNGNTKNIPRYSFKCNERISIIQTIPLVHNIVTRALCKMKPIIKVYQFF